MNRRSFRQPRLTCALALGAGAISAAVAAPCTAGCGMFHPGAVESLAIAQQSVKSLVSARAPAGFTPAAPQASAAHGIVGLWNVTFISDGSAYPGPIPAGIAIDFGTVQWHADGTEIMVSGGRPPSSGDVCMGVWKQTGPFSYTVRHVAFAWVSADTPPPLGPVSPAAFLGPATLRQALTLNHAGDAYSGTFTIDQYASDGVTLLEHVGGTIEATRIEVD